MFRYLRNKIISRAETRVARLILTMCNVINVEPGPGLFNHQCHNNCVQFIHDHPKRKLEIVQVLCLSKGDFILHYLIYDTKKRIYLDVTLGHQSRYNSYYLIKSIRPCEQSSLIQDFGRDLDYWTKTYVPWIWRKLFGIDRIL